MKTNKNKNGKRSGWDTFVQLPASQIQLGTSPVPNPCPTADDPANPNMTPDPSSPSLTAFMNSASELAVWLWLRVERNSAPQRPCGSRETCHRWCDKMTGGEVGQGALVHRISTRRKREGLQSRNKRSWGITLKTVLADVAASPQPWMREEMWRKKVRSVNHYQGWER